MAGHENPPTTMLHGRTEERRTREEVEQTRL